MSRVLALLLFLILTLGGGILIGVSNPPGEWYAGLEKAWFNPPNWLFAPAWTILYTLIAIAGWRIWRVGDGVALRLWALQLALNFCWSPIFFTLHLTGAALVVILAMLAVILAFIARTVAHEPPSALLFLPYAAWVAFASLLNGSIWWLNA